MAFFDTSALITDLWYATAESVKVKDIREKHGARISTLVEREFLERVGQALIRLHAFLLETENEAIVLHYCSQEFHLTKIMVTILAGLKARLGAWDGLVYRYEIEALLEGALHSELKRAVGDPSDLTRCEVRDRNVKRLETGVYDFDFKCRKREARCNMPAILKKRITREHVAQLSMAENSDVNKIASTLSGWIEGTESESSVTGRDCNHVADLVHVVEADHIGEKTLVTTDKAFVVLSQVVKGPKIITVEIQRPARQRKNRTVARSRTRSSISTSSVSKPRKRPSKGKK